MKLRNRIENHIVDDMTPKQVRYLQPVLSSQASGKLAEIYRQVRNDFQLVPPITLFSPAPELLAGLWSISRESQIAQRLDQWHGEDVGLSRQWLEEGLSGLPRQHYDIASLVLLTAFAPYQVDKSIIEAFRQHYPTDAELLAATCWASYAAIRRISQWLSPVPISVPIPPQMTAGEAS